METTVTELNNKVDDLLSTRDEIADLREKLEHYTAQEASLKADILAMSWPESTLKYDDVTISRVETKDVKVTDPKLVITWLKRNKIDPNNFMKLDLVKVKPVLKTALFTQGKHIQGTEHEVKESLRVTEV